KPRGKRPPAPPQLVVLGLDPGTRTLSATAEDVCPTATAGNINPFSGLPALRTPGSSPRVAKGMEAARRHAPNKTEPARGAPARAGPGRSLSVIVPRAFHLHAGGLLGLLQRLVHRHLPGQRRRDDLADRRADALEFGDGHELAARI